MAKKIKSREEEFIHSGGRNLLLLCFSSIVIATITTTISLIIYQATGDIYLDRSRPGYIAEDEKHTTEDDNKENFSSDGAIDVEALKDYKTQLESVEKRLDSSKDAFDGTPLSNETLGIQD